MHLPKLWVLSSFCKQGCGMSCLLHGGESCPAREELNTLDGQIFKRLAAEYEVSELRIRLKALEEAATALEADIDCGRPLEYNTEHLRDALIRARTAIESLPPSRRARPELGDIVAWPDDFEANGYQPPFAWSADHELDDDAEPPVIIMRKSDVDYRYAAVTR